MKNLFDENGEINQAGDDLFNDLQSVVDRYLRAGYSEEDIKRIAEVVKNWVSHKDLNRRSSKHNPRDFVV